MAAILAAPDDDAPRLVWADREGGERGELVVVQCAIAAGSTDAALVAREKELLRAHGETWGAPDLVVELRRGFVEHAVLWTHEITVEFFERFPTVRSLRVRGITERANLYAPPNGEMLWTEHAEKMRAAFARLPPGRITALSTETAVAEDGDWMSGSAITRFTSQGIALAAEAAALRGLRELVIDGQSIPLPLSVGAGV